LDVASDDEKAVTGFSATEEFKGESFYLRTEPESGETEQLP
jgi:hypothetical protein